MKLTEYCIIFGVLLIGIFMHNDLKIKAVNETQMSQILLNKNMDEIVVDALEAGFTGIDENELKKVDLDIVSDHLFEEMSILFYTGSNMRSLVEKYVKGLIYIDDTGYYLYDKGEWQKKILFEADASHSDRVELVSKIIEERTKEVPLLSYNDGESYKNTIDDNTLIIVYCGYNFMTGEFVYKNSYLSAARIKPL